MIRLPVSRAAHEQALAAKDALADALHAELWKADDTIADLRAVEGMVWSYRIIVRGGRDNHVWTLIGDRGGIHVDAWETSGGWRDERWMGGIEGHSPTPREYDREQPDHEHCWVIGKPCWHDGSSLQFSEQIAPYLSQPGRPFQASDHLDVLHVMLSRYRQWLPELTAADAVPGGDA